MKKIGICGVYGDGPEFSGGQPVKVKTMIKMLSDSCGADNILTANTAGWRKRPVGMMLDCLKLARHCGSIVILPAHNGLRVFLPLFLQLRKVYRYKLFYSVIGGWLASKAAENPRLILQLKQLDGIWVETKKMQRELQALGVENTEVIPNVKYLNNVTESHIIPQSNVLRCCTFCRVIKEKGIEDAIRSVCTVNKQGTYKATLDIYGPIYEGYKDEFDELMKKSPNTIRYMGCADPSESVSTLCMYDVQIFPTHYKTEGIPGSIIDSYAAAVPVVASKWNSSSDIVNEGSTGLGYEIANVQALSDILIELCKDRGRLVQMSNNCIKLYDERYKPESAMKQIVGAIGWD